MGFSQARILECIAVYRRSSRPRDQTCVSCFAGRFCMVWATRESQKVLGKVCCYYETLPAYCVQEYWVCTWRTFLFISLAINREFRYAVLGFLYWLLSLMSCCLPYQRETNLGTSCIFRLWPENLLRACSELLATLNKYSSLKKKKVINVFVKMPSNKLFSIFHFQSVLLKKKLEEHLWVSKLLRPTVGLSREAEVFCVGGYRASRWGPGWPSR